MVFLGYQFTGGEFGEDIYWDAGIYELGIRSDLKYSFSKETHVVTGVDLGFQNLGLETQLPVFGGFERTFPGGAVTEDLGVVKTDESDRGAGYGLHTTLRTRLFGRLTLLPGVRFDAYVWEGQRRYSVEPRPGSADVGAQDRHLLKMSGGKYSKLPEPQSCRIVLVTPSSSSSAWQYGLGYEYRPDPFFHADLTLFYKKMFDLVGGNPDFVAGGSEPGLINNGDGRAYGVEVMLRHRPSPRPLYGWLAYTLSRSERFDRGDPDEGWTLFALDQTHILSSVLGYKWGRGWSRDDCCWITGNPTPALAPASMSTHALSSLRGERQ